MIKKEPLYRSAGKGRGETVPEQLSLTEKNENDPEHTLHTDWETDVKDRLQSFYKKTKVNIFMTQDGK